MKIHGLRDLAQAKEAGLKLLHPPKPRIMVGMATCGLATGAQEVFDALAAEVERQRLDVMLVPTGCLGYCRREPLVEVLEAGRPAIIYADMAATKARQLIGALARGQVVTEWVLAKIEEEEYLIEGKVWKYPIGEVSEEIQTLPLHTELPFWGKQRKIILRNSGFIDAGSLEEYIARGGYFSLCKALTKFTPEEVIAEVSAAGLRGRGGAGFPTGRKWQYCHDAPGNPKYVICNADEGDPGAYMDRTVLEGDPHSILEGMIIGAYAIGARKGYVYVRDEYPLAVKSIRRAVSQAQEWGLLGEDIMGAKFDFDIEIVRGAGAFVCGEETALIASIEGEIGEPRSRPPFPARSGLRGKPTVINNVKTWSSIAPIISRGSAWYAEMGTERSKGTTVFSLVGKINNTGLVEVPFGVKLREMVYDIGGGIPNGKAFKAVQTGGPSGGCIPASLLDLPVDYQVLTQAGSIMGSGGMVVMDEDTCMVDIARFFLAFTMSESCGKCIPCHEGIQQMHKILSDIAAGKGKESDIEFLEELGQIVKDGSLCGLGQTAPNPVLSTIRYFRDEYEAHIKYKRCPAVVCKEIISSPCQYVCPLGQDVPAYIGLIARRQFKEAIKIIRKENPLPSVCGRVCHHPCEDKCRLADVGVPIAIRALKRFAADYEIGMGVPAIEPSETVLDKVAIIGSGPAGLTAAYYLAQHGYQVTIFEALPVAGGMLAVGIPEYRLPKKILNMEIEAIKQLGVTIKTNTPVGEAATLEEIQAQGYKAIFLAVGAHKGLKLHIPGEDVDGVLDAIDFLKSVNLGKEVRLGNMVAVIGGGNSAIDAARVANRMGCQKVQIIYRRTKVEMPADKEEIEGPIEEGIDIHFLAAPVKLISSDGRLEGIECIRMELGEFDESGRRHPVPIEGSEFMMDVDTMIYAIGQQPDISFLAGDDRIGISRQNTIVVDRETLATSVPGIFAGGDAVSGPATVTEAIAAGKIAANSIHKYLRGESLGREYKVTRPVIRVEPPELSEQELEELSERGRPEMSSLPVLERINNFKEVCLGLTEEVAVMEAKRCLRCDLEVVEERQG